MVLPVNIDATYADDPINPAKKLHQQYHDQIHAFVNDHDSDEDAHADLFAAISGATDHGALTGLSDDDHTQYLLKSVVDAKGDLLVATADNTIGKVTVGANGSLVVADSAAPAGVAWRTPSTATVAASESTTSTSFTDLTTPGPALTVTTGTQALVIVTVESWNTTIGNSQLADFAVSGATTRAASDLTALRSVGSDTNQSVRASAVTLVTLTAGSNTFTVKYRVNAGTGQFVNRTLIVVPL